LTLDGTTRPMSLAIAVASVGTFLSVRLVPQRAPVPAS
jgi:hypothetical protein